MGMYLLGIDLYIMHLATIINELVWFISPDTEIILRLVSYDLHETLNTVPQNIRCRYSSKCERDPSVLKILYYGMLFGDLDTVKYIIENNTLTVNDFKSLNLNLFGGRFHIIKYICENFNFSFKDLKEIRDRKTLLLGYSSKVLRYIFDKYKVEILNDPNFNDICEAYRNKYYMLNFCDFGKCESSLKNIFNTYCSFGNIKGVKYLFKRYPFIKTSKDYVECIACAINGVFYYSSEDCIRVLKYLFKTLNKIDIYKLLNTQQPLTSEIFDQGGLNVIKCIQKYIAPISTLSFSRNYCLNSTIRRNNLKLLKYLCKRNVFYTSFIKKKVTKIFRERCYLVNLVMLKYLMKYAQITLKDIFYRSIIDIIKCENITVVKFIKRYFNFPHSYFTDAYKELYSEKRWYDYGGDNYKYLYHKINK